MKKQNKNQYKNILPLAILFLLLIIFYALASFASAVDSGKGDFSQRQAMGISSPLSTAEAAEYDPCGLDSVECPKEKINNYTANGGTRETPSSLGQIREVSMYTSRVQETDSSPCISADGTNICEYKGNVCASNAYKFGTRLLIEGLGECIVKDRMNRRYTNTVDWYARMDLGRALNFGRQKLKVKYYENYPLLKKTKKKI